MNKNENEIIYLLRNRDDREVLGVYNSKEILEERVVAEVTKLLKVYFDTSKMSGTEIEIEIRKLIHDNFVIETWELNK